MRRQMKSVSRKSVPVVLRQVVWRFANCEDFVSASNWPTRSLLSQNEKRTQSVLSTLAILLPLGEDVIPGSTIEVAPSASQQD